MLSEQEFKKYFFEYYNLLCNYAAGMIESPEDVVQEVFGSIWKRRDENMDIANIKTYLLGAVHRKCLETKRNQKLKTSPLVENEHQNVVSDDFESAFELEMDNLLLKEQIYRSIRQLSPKCQHIFVLAKIEGKSHKAIAESQGISIKTVENHINKAYKELRELLKHKL